MKITTKRFCKGEYRVYRDGKFCGTISNFATESNEWTGFDEYNNWIGTTDTKWYCLESCFQDNYNEGINEYVHSFNLDI